MNQNKPASKKLSIKTKPLRTLNVADIAKVAGGRAVVVPYSQMSPCY
jgi:hypothetical protein